MTNCNSGCSCEDVKYNFGRGPRRSLDYGTNIALLLQILKFTTMYKRDRSWDLQLAVKWRTDDRDHDVLALYEKTRVLIVIQRYFQCTNTADLAILISSGDERSTLMLNELAAMFFRTQDSLQLVIMSSIHNFSTQPHHEHIGCNTSRSPHRYIEDIEA